jgi:hypothetical protein
VIHDIGTQFEARVETDSLRIRVREGEVALQQAPADLELTGTAGEEIEVSAAGNLRTGVIAPDAALWQWAQSLASAPAPASQSILVYLRWIARETGKRLEFELANVELSAQFASFSGDPAGLSPLEVLNHIAATSDFRYQLTEDGAILIGRN